MKSSALKIARIGNSRGVRLPSDILKRYRMDSIVFMEETAEGIVLRPASPAVKKLSWEETAAAIAAEDEDWSAWGSVVADDLDNLPWKNEQSRKIKEKPAPYGSKREASKPAIRRFEIRWTDLNPVLGAEMGKMRPSVVISKDELNARLQTIVVCPLTSCLHPAWRSRLPIECQGRPAEIAVDQIRTVSRVRFGRKLGSLSDNDAAALSRLIIEMYGE